MINPGDRDSKTRSMNLNRQFEVIMFFFYITQLLFSTFIYRRLYKSKFHASLIYPTSVFFLSVHVTSFQAQNSSSQYNQRSVYLGSKAICKKHKKIKLHCIGIVFQLSLPLFSFISSAWHFLKQVRFHYLEYLGIIGHLHIVKFK